ncbi:MAG TPA: type II toxin-antitoxin system VapC family toxin [Gemmataceae bacterium]|nr:type II toxin-antitoxin system VapC family toxin [Gemmataceae bacterium]
MIFDDLLSGASLFVDANPLVYYFASDPLFGAACARLIARIQNQELRAYTSTHVLSEAAHKLMAVEAAAQFGWKSKVVQHLRQQPDKVQQLTRFRQAIQQVPQLGIQVLSIAPALIDAGALVSQQTGLLTNDALIVAVMQTHGLTQLVSNDPDFNRVPGITRYAPV